ncbi:serine hydrolase [Altererythrobacter sp. H2]|uniref:serine hydrolase n=1 Tax=Altererythrobacter sp. H2 TaxID=3108391 RepID=UPI002B4BBE44|nr:serine hydrolase [Altererythrobacter sp. H2]WRK96389.1 serine hydrolase [Altererythrobacter sp. H2]
MSVFARYLAPALAAVAMTFSGAAQAQGAQGGSSDLEAAFDNTLGTQTRAPQTFNAVYESGFDAAIARVASGEQGRIGVAAIDLASGKTVSVLGDQRFPMASTSKIAIAATYLEGVEQGRWSLSSEFPLLIPERSARFSTARAPVRKGNYLPAIELIELMITRSSNPATDALLQVVGGPQAVNDWMRRAGIREFELTRDIATLVRDDGEFDPASIVDRRDSATPKAMLELMVGLHEGRWLNAAHRQVILGAMERTVTGKRRIRAMLPASLTVGNKTGSLNNTSSDIGFIRTPDGRAIALAIYVTGQGSRAAREARIAQIARAIYDGYSADSDGRSWAGANYTGR